ncbi:MAG: peptide ABC transporter substrate-binding protein [Solobacterium sp.]|nr:peptide ABC transporter substrate-binding protein [Solobacterium sp.]
MLKKGLIIGMSLALLVGCGGNNANSNTNNNSANTSNETTSNENTASQETKAVTLQAADLISMDTATATDGGSFIAQTMCISGLMELDENNNPIPDLAESYEVSDDGLTYTFKIRDDAKWANGDPVTADDFVYGWQRVVDPANASDYNWIFETANVENGDCYDTESGKTKEDLGIKAVDEKTVEVKLVAPSGFFLSLLAFPSFFPVNRKFAEEKGDQYALSVENILACGPYVMTSWTPGYSYEFELNDQYFGYEDYKAANTVDKVTFRVITDTQTALLEYQSKNIDTVQLSGEQVDANKEVDGFTNRLQGYLFYLMINVNNNADNDDFKNLNVRQAMSYALDREAIVTAMNDGSVAAEGIIPISLACNPDTGADFREDAGALVSYDLDKAKEYYEAAKKELGHDITLELLYDTDQGDSLIKAAEQVQYFLEQAGFTVNLNGKPKKERLSLHSDDHNFDVVLTRWGPDYADPQTYMDLFKSTNTTNNDGAWANAKYDELVNDAETGKGISDPAVRWQDFLDAEKVLVLEDAGIVPVFQMGSAMIINPEIEGIQFHSAGVDNYRHIVFK